MPHHQTYIAGVKYRGPGTREALAELLRQPDPEVYLEPEEGNQYDVYAVKVVLGNLRHVGYVPAPLSPEVRRLIAAGRIDCVKLVGKTRIQIHYREPTDGESEAEIATLDPQDD